MPTFYRKKLIEVALPLEDINREAAREKSIRHGHPSTLHLWWARRPLAACRAVLFASLVDDPEGDGPDAKFVAACQRLPYTSHGTSPRERLFSFIAELVKWENSNNEDILKTARELIGLCTNGQPPPVYDPFCGGGSIPLEAQRLGLEAHASDLNPVPVLINKALIEIPPRFAGKPPVNPDSRRKLGASGSWKGAAGLAEDIRYYGQWMRDEAEKRIGHLYPKVKLPKEHLSAVPGTAQAGGGGDLPAPRPGVFWVYAHLCSNNSIYIGQTDDMLRRWDEHARGQGSDWTKKHPPILCVDWQECSSREEAVKVEKEWKTGFGRERLKRLVESGRTRQAGATVIAWLWARTVASPNPAAKGAHVPLVRSFWLSTKAGKKAWVEPVVDQSTMTYRFEVRTGNGEPRAGTVNRNGGVCLLTGSPMPLEYVRAEGKAGRLGARLMAIVAEGNRGRLYLSPTEEHERVAQTAQPHNAPDTDLPEQALGFRVQNYGMTKHRHLFTHRQLAALITFCDLLGEVRDAAVKDSNEQAYADAVATYLSFAIGRGADKWASLTIWNSVGEKIEHVFGRNALSMTWDFPEGNVFSESTGNWFSGVEWVWKSVGLLPSAVPGNVRQLAAQDLPHGKHFVFSTDPPYYDNVPYADLSDFFYVWLRRCLQPVYPQLLGTVLVPKAEELVAEPFRHGSKEQARIFFEEGMRQVFARMREASDERYPTTVYYAFKQAEGSEESEDENNGGAASRASTGWETFLQGLIDSGWQLDGTWPLRTERPGRLRDQASNALASSIVLVCRPRAKDAGVASRRDFLAALKRELPEALRNLQKGNIAPVDLAQAAIGPGMAVFSRYARVLETDGSPMGVRTALALINQSLDEVLAEQEGEFDADTRWALAWFDQYGFTEGPYGAAETLCTAKNTSVSGMTEAGILAAKGGKVRLLKKEELLADWNPATDVRLTIWEATHHLIRALDQGEQSAAELLRKLGPISETARDLSYRLYTVCERRKWAQEAIGYNALVLSWPDLTRLAQEQKAAGPAQGEMQL